MDCLAYYERDGRWKFAATIGGYRDAALVASQVFMDFPTRAVLLKLWSQYWVCTPGDMTGMLLKKPSGWSPDGEPTDMTFQEVGLTSQERVPSLATRAR